MQKSVRDAIAKIEIIQAGKTLSWGTGFLVADGLVLTALHVVADHTKQNLTPYPGEIRLTFPNGRTKASIFETHWDLHADWALLQCESPPPDTHPLLLAQLSENHVPWDGYGFPEAKPSGFTVGGIVRNCGDTLDDQMVFQLFSDEASAGDGFPVKGLSGGPVLVQDAVVGLLRWAPMKDGQSVGGTLYACPILSVLEKTGTLLRLPDPCFGLPGLPIQDLPAEPYRYLTWFTEKEAEVFFGRNRDIRRMYDRLTEADGPPLILLYGQSGVGKSSFLDAGLVPRLRANHAVAYVRRDANSTLTQTLLQTLLDANTQDANPPATIGEVWSAAEERAGKPLLVFFDQIEEVYTHPNKANLNELEEFGGKLKELFAENHAPRGRLILSFRKEWLAEVQKQMDVSGISYDSEFLKRLDRAAIVEVVTGLTKTSRLQNHYNLTVESDLPGAIAQDLGGDLDSPISTTLQILLTTMWQKAKAEDRGAPQFTEAEYRKQKQEGLLLKDFLDRQLAALKKINTEWTESGLALDLLAFHTTSLLTSKERTPEELFERYHHHEQHEITDLLQKMNDLSLLSDQSADKKQDTTRLIHDTLAPVVREMFDRSEKPGQHARRILESRIEDWEEGSETGLLDEGALLSVEKGTPGMRAPTEKELKLIAASRVQQQKRRRERLLVRYVGVGVPLFIIIAVIVATTQIKSARREKDIGELRYTGTQMSIALQNEPVNGLIIAVHAISRSRQILGYVNSEVVKNLETALESARERASFPQAQSAALSSDGAIALSSPYLEFRSTTTGKFVELVEDMEVGKCAFSQCVKFSPDDKIVSFAGDDGIFLWTRAARRGRVIFPTQDSFLATSFSTQSDRILGITSTGTILESTVSGQKIREFPVKWLQKAISEHGERDPSTEYLACIAILFTSNTEGFIAAGVDDKVYLSDLTGNLLAPPFEGHRHTISSVALSLDQEKQLVMASGDENGNLLIWNDNGKLRADPIHLHSTVISALAFNPQGDLIISAGSDGAVNFSTLTGRRATQSVTGFSSQVHSLAFSPDGSKFLAISDHDTKLIDTYGIRIPWSFRPNDDPRDQFTAVALGSQGTVAVGRWFGDIILWHPPTGFECRIKPKNEGPITEIAFTGDESILASQSFLMHDLRLWDRNCNAVGDPWTNVVAFDLDPEGKFLIASNGRGLELFDIQSRKELHQITDTGMSRVTDTGMNTIVSIKLASDRSQGIRFTTEAITATGRDLQFWAIRSQKIEKVEGPKIHTRNGWIPFLSPTDKSFVAGNATGEIQLLRADGSKSAEPFNPHDSPKQVLGAIAFPDGETTASIIQDGQNVSLCRFVGIDGCVPVSVPGHLGGINAIAISPDGKTLVSAGKDNTIRLLRPDWKSWLEISCDRLRNQGVFQNPKFPEEAHLDQKLVQETEETCKNMVWDKK